MIKIFLVCRDEVEKKLYGNDRSVSGEAQSIIASCNPIHLINTPDLPACIREMEPAGKLMQLMG